MGRIYVNLRKLAVIVFHITNSNGISKYERIRIEAFNGKLFC